MSCCFWLYARQQRHSRRWLLALPTACRLLRFIIIFFPCVCVYLLGLALHSRRYSTTRTSRTINYTQSFWRSPPAASIYFSRCNTPTVESVLLAKKRTSNVGFKNSQVTRHPSFLLDLLSPYYVQLELLCRCSRANKQLARSCNYDGRRERSWRVYISTQRGANGN